MPNGVGRQFYNNWDGVNQARHQSDPSGPNLTRQSFLKSHSYRVNPGLILESAHVGLLVEPKVLYVFFKGSIVI